MFVLLLLLSITLVSHQQQQQQQQQPQNDEALELAKTLNEGYLNAKTLEELNGVFVDPVGLVSCKNETGFERLSELAEDLKDPETKKRKLVVFSAKFLDLEKNKVEYTTKIEGGSKKNLNFIFEAKKNGQGKYLIESEKCVIVA